MSDKKVLIISYYFPPIADIGVMRTLKFIKYLPQYGWQPVVLTAKNSIGETYDDDLLQQIPKGTKVINTFALEPRKIKIIQRTVDQRRMGQFTFWQGVKIWILARLRKIILVPDEKIGWFPHAVIKGRRVLREEDISIFYTTSYPYTAHLIGLFLKFLTRKKWIVDMRDLWCENPFFQVTWRDRVLENLVYKYADKIILNNVAAMEKMIKVYPQFSYKMCFITNGFDEDELRRIPKRQSFQERLSFAYAGSFYENIDIHISNI